jgi:hypothetical protein
MAGTAASTGTIGSATAPQYSLLSAPTDPIMFLLQLPMLPFMLIMNLQTQAMQNSFKAYSATSARATPAQPAAAEQGPPPTMFVQGTSAGLDYRKVFDYDIKGNLIYLGESNTGTSQEAPTWRIRNIIYDGNNNVIDIRWAKGNQNFDKSWNLRTGYVYT